ncbi:MAG TPA: hypothetical protein VKF62_01315, partial [Planctomycetota bacterium]|nr:hypothetical protein [Planctomycetota bacterium]
MPFSFPSWTPNVGTLQASNNGWLSIDQIYGNLGPLGFENSPILNSLAPNAIFAPWWNDLILPPTSTGSVSYLLAGAAPNQTLTVEWNQEQTWAAANTGNGDPGTFQVVLHEGTGVVDYHYSPAGILGLPGGGTTGGATVGWENHSGTAGADLTGLGDQNTLHPLTDFTLTPSGFTTTGAVIPSYTMSTLAPAYASITGTPGEIVTWIGLSTTGAECGGCGNCTDDDDAGPFAMPFPFKYFLADATSFSIDSNGFLAINGGGCGGYINQVPGSASAAATCAAWWDDITHRPVLARTSRRVTGPPGNQQLVIQWENLTPWSGGAGNCTDLGNRVSYQVVLEEGSNNIEFHYGPEVPGGGTWDASVGITDLSGAYGIDATFSGTNNGFLPTNNFRFDPCEPCGEMSTFGPGCGPIIASSGGSATPGNLAYALTESGAPPGSFGLLFLGTSNTLLAGAIPLPFPIAGFGFAGGCSVLIDPTIFWGTAVVGGGGSASLGVPIPPGTPSCAGPVYAQWFNFSPPT